MGYIAGLSEGTKLALIEFCHRHRITQIAWVNEHLDADLAAEAAAPDTKEEAAS